MVVAQRERDDTMTTVPTRVGMYFRGSGQWERIAVFQLVDGAVTVVHRDDASDVVTSMMTEGYWVHGRGQTEPVTVATPEAFMAALVEPHDASYYQYRNESTP